MLLKKQWINKEIKEEIRECLETNENKNTALQNLWGGAKAVLRGNFMLIQAYLKKQETTQIKNLAYYLKELEKEKQSPKSEEERK